LRKDYFALLMSTKTIMSNGNTKYWAFFAYLLNIIGALYVLLARRNDKFAVYHAKQSLGITLLAIAVFVIWIVVAWIIAWIPYVGFIFAMALFSLVIAAYLVLAIVYILGMKYALDEKMQPVPIFGGLAERISSMLF
jgi:uncharacterized membrane protein